MKIKAKLTFGIGLLFAMIALLTIISATNIYKLSNEAKNILADNYKSIDYCRLMINALNSGISDSLAQNSFRENLHKQQLNVTETGEKELTLKIASDYFILLQSPQDTGRLKDVQKSITDIMLLNMQSIQRKNELAGATAETAIFWITASGTICFLIAFTLLINLPSNIANPIKELTASIKQIAAQNYTQRVYFEQHDEFGELASAFNTMAQKLKEYSSSNLAKLMVEKKRIETLINNMSNPVIGLDEEQVVLFMNDVALKITGVQKEEAISKPILELARENDLIKTLVQDLSESQPDKIKSPPIKIYADHKESYFEKEIIPIKIVPTGDKQEKQIGNVVLLKNVTPYKEKEFAKTNFIATVSHELRTPISSIKMSLQLLEHEQVGLLNTEQQSLVESIKEDAGRLLKITGELLNMTQVESGTIQINVLPADVHDIVEYAVSATKSAAEEKQIKVEIKAPEYLPKVLADSEKTAWVLTNLLSNAVRYSYDNTIIYIDIIAESHEVKVAVTDTGQGISSQYIDKIFDRYFRIPGTKKEGTGLGLSISKEFIEAQGGRIDVKSDLGTGSTFSFALNVA
ncbi:ATP-binding protein [Niabella insulamsoli]|uniref:ATP-binding protein n=1 Tax=Niabella insulamsoli TaxID=3144874 RepID=UPI0031FDB086